MLFVVLAAFVYFIQNNIGVIRNTYRITAGHLTLNLVFAIFFVVLSEFILTYSYKKIFDGVGIIRKFFKMMVLHLSGLAVSIIIPSGGFSGALVYADDTREKESRGAAITGFLLAGIADYSAIAILLIFAMLYLSAIGSLGLSVFIPSLIFLGITFFLYFLVWISANGIELGERILRRSIRFFAAIIEKMTKKKIDTERAITDFLKEFSSASKYILGDKKDWLKTITIFIFSHLVRIVALYIIFVSLGYDLTYRALIVGYTIGTLFIIISPTPSGVGFVEGAMVLSYVSLHIPTNIATTVVLIYRGLAFWLPFFIGFGFLQGTRINKIKKESLELDV